MFTVFARVKNCKLLIKNKDRWNGALLTFNDKDVKITISDDKDTRSNQQNRFYWLYLTICESETGNDANDLHEYFKRKFLPPRFVTILGKEVKLPASTTKMDKLQFTNYLDKICAETEIPIPQYDN